MSQALRPYFVFSSSSGETFRAAFQKLSPAAQAACQGLISDRECGALQVAREILGSHKVILSSKTDIETQALEIFQREPKALLFLCGYFGILSPHFVQKCPLPIVNTHPSLLPAFPGMDKKVQRLAAETVAISGFTLHLVTEALDGGPILYQQPVLMDPRLSIEESRLKVRECEQKWLGAFWERLLASQLEASDSRLTSRDLRLKHKLWETTFTDTSTFASEASRP